MKNNERGVIGVVEIGLVVAMLLVAGFAFWKINSANTSTDTQTASESGTQQTSNESNTASEVASTPEEGYKDLSTLCYSAKIRDKATVSGTNDCYQVIIDRENGVNISANLIYEFDAKDMQSLEDAMHKLMISTSDQTVSSRKETTVGGLPALDITVKSGGASGDHYSRGVGVLTVDKDYKTGPSKISAIVFLGPVSGQFYPNATAEFDHFLSSISWK